MPGPGWVGLIAPTSLCQSLPIVPFSFAGGQRTSWIPHATVRTADELETLRQGQRVTVHKTTFHGKNRHFRCNRHRHNERCMFKLLAVTENNGTINVFRSGEHNHPIQQISNCVY
ncbi:unnamed protein product [Meloidogyne enterolobii]|uniref:Uncharacterized protein n=1 Tax=Meloidogyne enterolobii TaxID=390850 RepID=A0ACB0XQC0_MELEN